MRMRLLEDHPTVKALEEVFSLMQAHELSITVLPYGTLQVTHAGKEYLIKDNDNSSDVYQLPPVFEYKLTYERD